MPEQTPNALSERREDELNAVLELMASLAAQIGQLNASIAQHRKDQQADLETVMIRAFPDGDPEGHRRHHEAVVRAAEARAEFWAKMRFALSQWGLLGFLGWAAYQLWLAFLQGPPK